MNLFTMVGSFYFVVVILFVVIIITKLTGSLLSTQFSGIEYT